MEIIMEVFILKIIGIFIVFAIISGIYLVKLLNKETLRNCRKIKLPFILTNYNISITMFLSHSGG